MTFLGAPGHHQLHHGSRQRLARGRLVQGEDNVAGIIEDISRPFLDGRPAFEFAHRSHTWSR